MDKIFHPSSRKWVSRPVQMGKWMAEVKNLVRLKKDNLVIIDPTPTVGAYMGAGIDTDAPGYAPEFMKSEAMKFENEESILDDEPESLKQRQDKWSDSDAACEAAVTVAKVVDKDFFLFKKKKKEKGEKRKRDKAKVEEDMDEDDEEDEDEDDADYEQPGTSSNNGNRSQKLMDSTMYERYNYDQSAQHNCSGDFQDELEKMMAITDANERREINMMAPEAFNESDDNDEDWLDCDDDTANFAGFAQRWDGLKEMIENGLEDSEEEDEPGNNISSDEEEQADEQPTMTSPEDGQAPCSSKSLVPVSSLPPRSAIKQSEKRRNKSEKRVTITCIKEEVDDVGLSDSNCNTSGGTASTANESTRPKKETVNDDTTDFKRFTDWVFSQNSKRDKESRKGFRPNLIEQTNMTEEQVRVLQCLTSPNLAAMKGEVFQDEAVMQSSSMPLLAPPTNIMARTTLQSLAIFLTHGEDPSVFPWKSINVQQQMNDDFIHHQFMKRMEQQKRDVINPAMKGRLVNKEDDFLVQILIYQATDPEDVLPDEVKLNRKLSNDVDIIVALNTARKRGKPAGAAECSQCEDDGPSSSLIGPHRFIEPKLGYEVQMLGSQTVKDLMHVFHCENDYVCLKDTPHPDCYKEDPNEFAKAKFPWSMIVINDTIYTDPECDVDYTDIINEWASKPPLKCIGEFKKGDWNSKLKDVTLRFGFPYVYVHLGGCEHIYVFTKSRLLHLEDDHLLSSYPNIVGMTRFKNVYCRVDNEYLARWAVLDFKEFPENPMLLCTECVLMYCYDKSKKKRGDFKLYPFTQMANIL